MRVPAIVLTVLAIGAGGAPAQEAVNRTVPTSPTGAVEIVNVAGQVRVTGWNRNEIRVTGTLGEGVERLDIDESGGHTEIRVVYPRRGQRIAGRHGIQGSDLEIRVPVRKNVTVRTTSADIEVGGVDGAVTARSTSGDVQVGGSPQMVTAGSTSGDVVVAATTSRVRANTTSGDVQVSGKVRENVAAESVSGDVTIGAEVPELLAKSVSGDLQIQGPVRRISASTVSGEASIGADRVHYLSFETVSGGLRFNGGLQRDAALNIQSHSGEVELALPANVGANFQVSTFSGDIRNEFGPQAQRTSRHAPGQELRFSNGGGGALITVKSFSGGVRLLKR